MHVRKAMRGVLHANNAVTEPISAYLHRSIASVPCKVERNKSDVVAVKVPHLKRAWHDYAYTEGIALYRIRTHRRYGALQYWL